MVNTEVPIAREFVMLAERIAAHFGAPKVRALHLAPGDSPAGKDGEFCAIELDDGSVGFSYVLLDDTLRRLQVRVSGDLAGVDALTVARGYELNDPVSRTLGFAVINALSQQLFSRAGWTPPDASDSAGELRLRPGERIGMVGLFRRLVPQIIESGAELIVLELRHDLAGPREGYTITLDPADLAACGQVVSTSTLLLNNTLNAILEACTGAHYLAIVGPTAGCVPDPLFARGVAVVGGTRVIDRQGFRDAFLAGEPWSRYTAKYAIGRHDYPGVDALLARSEST